MSAAIRWSLLPALVAGWLIAASPASAAVLARVKDEAGFFSPDAIKKANEIIREIKNNWEKDLLIETFPKIPAEKEEEYTKLGKEKFFKKWAIDQAKASEVRGLYILICKDPPRFEFEPDDKTKEKAWKKENTVKLQSILVEKFKAAHSAEGAEKTKLFDQGLIAACEYVRSAFKANLGSKSQLPPAGDGTRKGGAAAGGSSIWGWVCPLLLVVLVVWVIIAVIRAISGMGRGGYGAGQAGGPGYAGGGGGYGGGGGGGGFMTGMLGGLFGAAAGSFLYDRFFRGDSTGGGGNWGASSAHGADPSSGQDPTYSNDAGGGGDFGGDAGGGGGGGDFGGDAGGGGGDYGGGGDFGGGGGGGDYGGGGDFGGGGGGGDFGGGGGGDF
jgi:hypothetical protein